LTIRVGVLGGGWAGLAAAVWLARAGATVTVLEGSSTLGGRARRVDWQGHVLDNGQHILLGGYVKALTLISLVGGETGLFRIPLEWTVPGQMRLRCPRLPEPWHLAVGLLLARGLDWRDRYKAADLMRAVHANAHRAMGTVTEFLDALGQSPRLRSLIWEPICLAALNTPAEKASAEVFITVLRDSLLSGRAASDLCLPSADLSALFPNRAADYLRAHGGEVMTRWPVSGIQQTSEGFRVIGSGGNLCFPRLICAVGPWHLPPLVAQLPAMAMTARGVADYDWQSITTVYLGYPDTVRLHRPMLGLSSGPAQWVFDRGQTHNAAGIFAAVISASGSLLRVGTEEVARRVHHQLAEAFPLPTPIWQKTISEKRATFSCTPDVFRPSQQTAIPGFYLAGDYTASPYPGTLEAAVASGVKCAELILSQP
jgi:squalene-associated FAD-dependent desaturase